MFCPKCGRETPDENTTYCLGCGLNLKQLVFPTDEEAEAMMREQTESAPVPAFTYDVPAPEQAQSLPYGEGAYGAGLSSQGYDAQPEGQFATPEQPVKKKSKLPVIILAVILGLLVAGALAALVIFLLLGGQRVHIPLNDYVEVTFEGYDGRGTAEASFDEERFMSEYSGTIKLTGKGKRSLSGETAPGLLSSFSEDADLAGLFPLLFENGYLTPSTDLSNGDSVTFQWNLSEEAREELNEYMRCTVDATDRMFTVSGLNAVKPVDLFAGLTLSFSGVAPNGTAEIENWPTEDYTRELQYEIEPSEGLQNGDSVTVTAVASGNLESFLAENYGVRAEETTKTFTVEGLNAVAESYEDISDEVKRQMDRKAQELISDYFTSESQHLSYGSAEQAGAFFLTPNDPESAPDGQNLVVMVYRAKARVTQTEDVYEYVGDAEYYTWVSFSDIAMTEDGASDVDTETAVFSDNTFFYKIPDTYNGIDWLGYDLRGFETAAELEQDIKGQFGSDYMIESFLEGVDLNAGNADAEGGTEHAGGEPAGNEPQTGNNPDELLIEDNPDDELIIEEDPDASQDGG